MDLLASSASFLVRHHCVEAEACFFHVKSYRLGQLFDTDFAIEPFYRPYRYLGNFMILVCPSCKTNFKIPNGAIPAGGRTVRCAKCKNSWHAAPADIMRKPVPEQGRTVKKAASMSGSAAVPKEHQPIGFDGKLDDQAAADAASLRRSVQGTVAVDEPKKVQPDDEMFDEGVRAKSIDMSDGDSEGEDFGISARFKDTATDGVQKDFADDGIDPDGPDAEDFEDEDYDEDDFLVRRRADQRRQSDRELKSRRRKIMTGFWAALIVFWLLILYVFVFQKAFVQEDFPGTGDFVYGLFEGSTDKERFRPADGEPLTPSPAHAEVYIRAVLVKMAVEVRDGEQALVLSGYVENKGTGGANVPIVHVTVSDQSDRIIDSWNFDPPGKIIGKGQKLNFVEVRSPVPAGAWKAEVKVLEGTKSSTEGTLPPGIH